MRLLLGKRQEFCMVKLRIGNISGISHCETNVKENQVSCGETKVKKQSIIQ